MNTSIDHLNHWAENLLGFAWPMLWQSSLLIVVVFALDILLARRVRAAIRHTLWIVVLVKLLLPPALALPTGAAWWLWPAKPALTPVIKTETVTFDSTPLPDNFARQTVPMPVPPPPKLSGLGWAMLAAAVVSAGLLFSLMFNWLKVEKKSRRAPASSSFTGSLDDARQLAGLRGSIRLKLVDDAISPAVYGLFRPVILLPRALAEKLSATQLRAVLLHEAMHLRRGDVWVNCAQTLLQIAYWWHPLLWLANARIRRLREEAVDDAVMLALRGDADAYAPTLLEVAKFAFRRPLASLGLVGILESRSALRQRVERLVDFRPPHRAGVTFVSLFGIFLFGAVTLPMGRAPAAMTVSGSADYQWPPSPPPSSRATISTMGQPMWQASAPSHPIQVLIVGHIFWIQSGDLEALIGGLPGHRGYAGGSLDWITATNAKTLAEINQRIHSLGLKPSSVPRIVTISGNATSIYVGNRTNWYKFNCTPVAADGYIDLAFKAEFASVSPLGETNRLEIPGQAMVVDGGGVVVSAENPNNSSSNLVLVMSVKTVKPKNDPVAAVTDSSGPDPADRPLWAASSPLPQTIHVASTDTGPRFDVEHYRISGNSILTPQTISATLANIDGAFGTNVSFEAVKTVQQQLQRAYREHGYTAVKVTLPMQKITNATVTIQVREGRLPATNNDVIIDAPAPQASLEVDPNTMAMTTLGRKDIYNKLNHIRMDTVSLQNLPLSEVIRVLHEESQRRDPEHKGINFLFAPPARQGMPVNPATGMAENAPAPTNTATAEDIQIDLQLNHASLESVLDSICLAADHPIKYSIENYGVVFTDKDPNAAQYEMRTFKIDADKLLGRHVRKPTPGEGDYPPDPKPGGGIIWATTPGKSEADIQVKDYFLKLAGKLGVNMDPPKTLFYNESMEVLFVCATPADLDVFERAISAMNVGTDDPTAALARDGQMLYEMGKLEEARAKLKEALALDPDNKGAKYYLNLIAQAKMVSQSGQGAAHASQVPFVFAPIHSSYQRVSAQVNTADLITNDFRINLADFNETVRENTGEADAILGLKELATRAGMDLSSPEQISITNERSGELCVIATSKDMGNIVHILDGLHFFPRQIHIKARFIEVPKTYFDDEKNSIPAALTNGGILTAAEFRKFLHQVQSQNGSQELAEPEGTTIAGRQMQMMVGEEDPVITNYVFQPSSGPKGSSIVPEFNQVKIGQMFDVAPHVMPDGYTINLQATASRTRFFGYASPKGFRGITTNYNGSKIELPVTLPAIQKISASTQVNLYDGQTLVLLPKPEITYNGGADEKYRDRIAKSIQEALKKEGNKQLIVLVTATMIDPVGNRVHSDADMAFAKNRVPQQPIIWDSVIP
jgi:beta-lactamase regulating signal transducer with metallopeptidase domain